MRGSSAFVNEDRAIPYLFARLADDLDLAVAMFDDTGIERYRSARLAALLAVLDQLSASTLVHALTTLARDVCFADPASSPTKGAGFRIPQTSVRIGNQDCVVRAACAGALIRAGDISVVVHVECTGFSIPDTGELIARFGLTRREAEVALMLAVGASDRAIAGNLDISAHTARKHAEHIFGKLHLHSRKAFALRLAALTRTGRAI